MKWMLAGLSLLFLVAGVVNIYKGDDGIVHIGFSITFIGIGHVLYKIENQNK